MSLSHLGGVGAALCVLSVAEDESSILLAQKHTHMLAAAQYHLRSITSFVSNKRKDFWRDIVEFKHDLKVSVREYYVG